MNYYDHDTRVKIIDGILTHEQTWDWFIEHTEANFEVELNGTSFKDAQNSFHEIRDAYYELALVGEWVRNHVSIYDIESNYEAVSIVLNSDMTGTHHEDANNPLTWSVVNSQLFLDMGHYQNTYNIIEENGIIYFHYYEKEMPQENITWQSDSAYLSVSDFHTYLDDIFLIVDLSAENVADYCRLDLHTPHYYTNEWGETVELTTTGTTLLARNNVYEDGWLYLCSSSDLTIEVLYSEYTRTYTYTNSTSTETYPAGATTSTESNPYVCYFPMDLDQYFEDYTITTDLSVEKLSFGRAKGQIIFINSKFVEEVVCDKYEYRRSLKTVFSEGFYDTGFWNESMGDY